MGLCVPWAHLFTWGLVSLQVCVTPEYPHASPWVHVSLHILMLPCVSLCPYLSVPMSLDVSRHSLWFPGVQCPQSVLRHLFVLLCSCVHPSLCPWAVADEGFGGQASDLDPFCFHSACPVSAQPRGATGHPYISGISSGPSITISPRVSSIPTVPSVPGVLGVTSILNISKVTSIPEVSSVPGVLSSTNFPGIPIVSRVPSVPEVTYISVVPSIPTVPTIPSIPCVPSAPKCPIPA